MILDDQVRPELVRQTGLPTLKVVCSGTPPPNPAELLGSARMLRIVHELSTMADIVVLDTPPVNPVTDAALLAARFNCTILVIEAGRTSRAAVQRAAATVQKVGGTIVGTVLNKARMAHEAYYEYDDDLADGTSRPFEAAAAPSPSAERVA